MNRQTIVKQDSNNSIYEISSPTKDLKDMTKSDTNETKEIKSNDTSNNKDELDQSSTIHIPFFDKKVFEITMNIINLLSISVLKFEDNEVYLKFYVFVIQIIVSLIFIIEFGVFLYVLGKY